MARGKMGGEGCGRPGEEDEEEKGCHGGLGEGPQQPRTAQQMCDIPRSLDGRLQVFTGKACLRHLLPRVALA